MICKHYKGTHEIVIRSLLLIRVATFYLHDNFFLFETIMDKNYITNAQKKISLVI